MASITPTSTSTSPADEVLMFGGPGVRFSIVKNRSSCDGLEPFRSVRADHYAYTDSSRTILYIIQNAKIIFLKFIQKTNQRKVSHYKWALESIGNPGISI